MSSLLLPPGGDLEPDYARGALVLLRHGRTSWNDEGRITGWEDPPLNQEGACEAAQAGQMIAAAGLRIATVFTSLAQRAMDTAEVVLDIVGDPRPTVVGEWRLNERHFGLLQGLDRATASQLYGRRALRDWKHDPAAVPPEVPVSDGRHPRHDARYRHVERQLLPGAESIAQFSARVLECWRERIDPCLERGVNVLVVGHCHSLRVLTDQLDAPPTPSTSPPFRLPGTAILYPGCGNARELTDVERSHNNSIEPSPLPSDRYISFGVAGERDIRAPQGCENAGRPSRRSG